MDINALRHRLREAPFDFLFAVSNPSTLLTFDQEWLSLREDADKALQLSLLNNEDLSLARAAAALLATSADTFLKLDDEVTKRTAAFVDEMEDVFARLNISDIDHIATPGITSSARRRYSHSHSGIVPSYVPTAHSWIVQNIHNPYPSSEVKQRISRDAARPLRVITDWFKEVRRHIGWVAMCKNHFQGSRALAVQAAKHVYLHVTSAPQFSLSSDIILQFEDIRTRLVDMYSLVDDSGDLTDSTDDSLTNPSLSSRRSSSDYTRSRSSSSTPSLVFSTDDEDSHSLTSFALDDVPTSLGKRKDLHGEDETRPLKRNRSGFIKAVNGLKDAVTLSPAASTTSNSTLYSSHPSSRKRRLSDAATEWEDATLIPSSSSQNDSRPPLRTPKRCLSVSDSQPSPKRPCLPPAVGPRKQAVSTPVPIAHQTTPAVDDWFPFELSDTSLSVELFNWDVVVENDAFLYNSLFDNILQSDGQDFSNVTPLSDAYQSPTPLDLGISSAVDPSVLDISSAFIEPRMTQLMASISTHSPEPITATTTPVFDFDAFLSSVGAEPTEPRSTQSPSSPSTELSLNDSAELFSDL